MEKPEIVNPTIMPGSAALEEENAELQSSEQESLWGGDSSGAEEEDSDDNDVNDLDGEENRNVAAFSSEAGDAKGILRLGKEYENAKEARDDIFMYSMFQRKDLKYAKSESCRVTAKCNFEGCPWRVHVSAYSGSTSSTTLRTKTLIDEHRCIETERNKLYRIPRIVDACIDIFRLWPKMRAVEIKEHILSTYKIRVSLPQCREVRRRCILILKQEHTVQFERLWDYIHELRRSNPESTVVLDTEENVFRRMYVMYGAMKEGWRHCRSVIHLDGAFLKWDLKGELLSAVARDANDQLYPLAWAVVDVENKRNWGWFLELLIEDCDLSVGEGLTLVSDQQKGLILSVSELLPVAEHRMCARHIWANLKKKCNDEELKRLFWKAAKSYTEAEFKENMEKIKMIQPVGYVELLQQDARHWSRAFFSTICKCDSVDNNFSESFNSMIREARRKPVVEMLEVIRQLIMVNNATKLAEIREYNGLLTPRAQELVNMQKEIATGCSVFTNGRQRFEVIHRNNRYVVSLLPGCHQCSCRYTELTGIPCGHLIASIWEDNHGEMPPEVMVVDCWKSSTWKKVYNSTLEPVNGVSLWKKTTDIKVIPPTNKTMPGRPKKNKRRKEPFEIPSKGVISRHGRIFHCKHCRAEGHNSRTCPKKDQPRVPSPEKRARGRPRVRPLVEQREGTSTTRKPRKTNPSDRTFTVVESQESVNLNFAASYSQNHQHGYGAYVSPITGDTYHHRGPQSVDMMNNTVMPTTLQRERDLQKIRQRKRASTSNEQDL